VEQSVNKVSGPEFPVQSNQLLSHSEAWEVVAVWEL